MLFPLLAALFLTAQDAPAPELLDLSNLVAPLVAEHDVPALGIALIQEGRLVGLGAAGVRRRGDETPVTTDDLWHLGSCTKAMTATLVARLVERRVLLWDTRVSEAFDDVEVHPGFDAVTLVELLSHRAGLAANPPLLPLRMSEDTPREQRAAVARRHLAAAPAGTPFYEFAYSNLGYMIAGAWLERAADATWEDLLRREVFEPLGMASAGFGPPGSAEELDQPRGHRPTGEPVEPGPLADNPAALGPAGTVHATLADWARFVAAHLVRENEDDYLWDDTWKTLHNRPHGLDGDYALGWLALERPWAKGPILNHSGSNTMWFCVVWAAPEEGLAVLVTCNQGGEAARKATDAAASACLRLAKER